MKDSERDFGLCFLDAGLVVTLTQTDKRNFEDLFLAVVLLYFKTNIFPTVCIGITYVYVVWNIISNWRVYQIIWILCMYVCVGVCIYASFFGNECNKFSSNQICMFVWDIFYWYINLRRICWRRMCIYCMMYDFALSLCRPGSQWGCRGRSSDGGAVPYGRRRSAEPGWICPGDRTACRVWRIHIFLYVCRFKIQKSCKFIIRMYVYMYLSFFFLHSVYKCTYVRMYVCIYCGRLNR